ncbi:enoyl-CoA hydratase/isomerase family protein [Aromatoleum diolicum]|uniref:Enoyl-CoA hydratase/isomerase family protein n=1 Tax=Aromatoleum diolicum TaxID=75796 RepID=A0ABX1QFF9_9RHOO|nr:enoyl-CoA hydratase/isomerase family protein [Aromatoleum diolicum]NMG75746.1 enoyl-CoA hydratase/isomerase family protein [Aromatoleum diolicum]
MISLTIEASVATVTLCRAPVNAINEEWIEQLDRILAELERMPRVSVLWIRSRERLFCAGADLELIRSLYGSEEGRKQMIAMTRRMQQVYARLERLPQVSVAEIGGAALGGGFELALACDLRVVADTAKIGLPEAQLGLLPAAGGTQRMTRICGDAVARRLILGAEVIGGADAVALGCAHWVAPAAALESTARALVERIAALPGAALAECKHCIAVAVDGAEDGFEVELAGSAALLADAETQQRVQRFLDKQ